MRATFRCLAQHVPLIKFPNRANMKYDTSVKPHFFSNGLMPSKIGGSSEASVELRSELPLRFRYKPIDEIEIEDINFGAAEVLVK